MIANKATVGRYMAAFRLTDHAAILDCLTDDVEWIIPGMFHTRGKQEFESQIENDAFVGHPDINVTRVVEESDIVVAEGSVRCTRRDGGILHVVFCDVFVMRGTWIRQLTSYLMPVNA